MTNQHITQAIVLEDGRDLTIEDGTCLGAFLTTNINTFIIQPHIFGHSILTETAHNDIRSGNRHRKNATVLFKTTGQLAIFRIHTVLFDLTRDYRGRWYCRFCGGLLVRLGFFLLGFLTGLFFGTLASFFLGTFTGLFDFLFNQTVNLCIQLVGRATLLVYFILDTFLLALQTI